jgi:hypothetical protein
MATKDPGLLGFEERTEEERLADNARLRAANMMEQAQAMSLAYKNPAERQAAQIGGLIGAYVGQKVRPSGLTEQDKRELALQNRTKELFTQRLRKATEEGRVLSPEDKNLELRKATANAFLEAGKFDKYNTLVEETAQLQRVRKQTEAQQALLNAAVGRVEDENSISRAKAEKATAGDSLQVYVPDESGNYDLSGLPVIGRLLPDQKLEVYDLDGNKTVYNQFIPFDVVDAMKKARMTQEANGLGGRIKLDKLFDNTERRDYRATSLVLKGQMDSIGRVADAVTSMLKNNDNPDVIFGKQGGALRFVENLRAGIKSGVDFVTHVTDDQGNEIFSSDKALDSDTIARMSNDPVIANSIRNIQVPPTLRGAKEQAAYRSSVIQLAYATWRTMEGSGARQASNQDFSVALEEIGASSGSARTMLNTVMSMLDRGVSGMVDKVQQSYAIGEYGGYSRKDMNAYLYGNSIDDVMTQYGKTKAKVSSLLKETPVKPEVQEEPTSFDPDSFLQQFGDQ